VAAALPESGSVRELRAELARIDRAIVVLLAARLTVAGRVIQVRQELGEKVTLRTQERLVLERVRLWSQELGVPPEVAVAMFRTLIDAGKDRSRPNRPLDRPVAVGAPALASGSAG